MARRKRRAVRSKKTTLKRGKGKKRPAAARKKVVKHGGRKTAAKKVAKRATVKAKAKRTVRKKAMPPTTEARQVAGSVAEITETTVVDIVGEPAPGVVVVTEIETVETTIPSESKEGSDLAEGENEKP